MFLGRFLLHVYWCQYDYPEEYKIAGILSTANTTCVSALFPIIVRVLEFFTKQTLLHSAVCFHNFDVRFLWVLFVGICFFFCFVCVFFSF